MTKEEEILRAREHMAGILRQAAQLVEEGVIDNWELNKEWGHRTAPDPATGGYTMRYVPTGEDTVTIVLKVGRLCRERAPSWPAEERISSNTKFSLLPGPRA